MKILFLHTVDDILSPAKPLRTPEEMQFGISYISAFLKRHGHQTRLVILSRILGKRNIKILDMYLKRFYPQLICCTAVSTEYDFTAHIARHLKKRYPDIYLLIGGPHASLNPEEVLASDFDAVCVGEGEGPALELVSQLEKGKQPGRIANLWIKHGSDVERNPARPFLLQLDDLPFPDREMWKEWIDEEDGASYPVLLGRGCPFQCSYCCNHALRRLADGSYVRFRSPDNIIEELKKIITGYPTKRNIYLEVETIGADKRWALELCSKLEYLNSTLKAPLSYGVNLRIAPNIDLETLFAAFKRSNFKFINIGLESGSERVRYEILKRNYSNRDIIDAVRLAGRHGLKVNFYNLIGIPGESANDFKETIRINRLCQPNKAYAHIFFPYPGTELYSRCKKEGLLKGRIDTALERCKAVLELPDFSKKQIQNEFIWFDYHIYKGYRPMREILTKVLISKLRSNTNLHRFYRPLTYSAFFKRIRRLLGRRA